MEIGTKVGITGFQTSCNMLSSLLRTLIYVNYLHQIESTFYVAPKLTHFSLEARLGNANS